MQFITFQFFLFFLGVFAAAILLKENKKYYRLFLLLASLAFYSFFGVVFFLVLVLNICLNYLLFRYIEVFGKKVITFSIVLNILFLALFKYFNFGIDSFLQVLHFLNMPADIQVLRLLIPVGISFHTFKNISYPES